MHRQITKDIIIKAGEYVIKQSDKLKILGIYITSGLDQTPNVNNIISKVNHRINILNKITKYTNIKTSLILYNSLVISVFSYCANNMINTNCKQLNKLNVLLNKCTHKILGITSYKLNTTSILNKLNWLSYYQIIIHESIKLVHRISYESQPPALSQLLFHSLVRSDIDRQVANHWSNKNLCLPKHQTIFYTGQFTYITLYLITFDFCQKKIIF